MASQCMQFQCTNEAMFDNAFCKIHGPIRTIDIVNNPPHYKSESGLEAIQVIEAFKLGFNLGNCIKYILRAGKKISDPSEDLRKARFYLNREIGSS